MKLLKLVAMAIALAVTTVSPVLASDVGIVLMHGKWGAAGGKSPIGKLKAKLEGAGFDVVTPDMPWHRNRYLAKGYEGSMQEIDDAVSELRNRGATKIVVAGHSMGANAALGYGARREGLAGIMAIAPGHVPGDPGYAGNFTADVAKAKAMVESGKGSEEAEFGDINQGQRKSLSVSAEIYLSWFSPDGPAVMRTNAANLKAPLLWIVGSEDRMADRGEGFAFSHAPSNERNHYKVIDGNHMNTPIKGASDIIGWLKGL